MANRNSTNLIVVELANHGPEEADMHARNAYGLVCAAINDPDSHESYLEGAKALLRQSRTILQRLINDEMNGKSEVRHGH